MRHLGGKGLRHIAWHLCFTQGKGEGGGGGRDREGVRESEREKGPFVRESTVLCLLGLFATGGITGA
jgi:hypothetical protein